jgi:hypothetical protein
MACPVFFGPPGLGPNLAFFVLLVAQAAHDRLSRIL